MSCSVRHHHDAETVNDRCETWNVENWSRNFRTCTFSILLRSGILKTPLLITSPTVLPILIAIFEVRQWAGIPGSPERGWSEMEWIRSCSIPLHSVFINPNNEILLNTTSLHSITFHQSKHSLKDLVNRCLRTLVNKQKVEKKG